jgi:hypothetical protein
MASNPIGKCCTVGVKHEGTPVGEMKKIGDGVSNPYRARYDDYVLIENSPNILFLSRKQEHSECRPHPHW